jgi:hypothetical protein
MKEKFKILLLLLFPVLAYGAKGDSEFKRTITKEYNHGSNSTLNISNKYGKVIIHTWSKNAIKATIVITGFGKSVEEAQSVANMVDINANFNTNLSTFQTVYNPSGSGNKWFSWGSGKKDSKDYVNINYEVYVPDDLAQLSIDNNFGDVVTDVLSFPASFSMNYCTYDIKEAQKPLDLHMNYCQKGRIGKADVLDIKANYSTIKCESIGSLTTSSNYSEYTLGSVGRVEAKGNYDEYTIQKAGSFIARGTYTDFRINDVQTEVTANLVYGDLSIKNIGQGFKKGDMHLTYTDVKLGFQQNVAFQISVHLTSGDLNTGDLSFKNVTSIKKSSQLSYTGSAGGAGDQSPQLNIQGVYSDIDLSSR